MQKKFLILAVFLVLLLGFGYWGYDQLGGNNPIIIELINEKPENLVGKTFVGIPQDEKLGEIFQEIQTKKSLNAGTFLYTIYEVEPAGKLDTMIVFVGINQLLPEEGYDFKSFEAKRYLVAKISGSSWIMPGPEKVKEKLAAFAAENNLVLNGIFVDKLIQENEVQVIAPILDPG